MRHYYDISCDTVECLSKVKSSILLFGFWITHESRELCGYDCDLYHDRHLNSISLCLYLLFRFFYSIIFILTCNSLHTRKTSYITNRLNRQANRLKLFFHRRTFDEGQTKNISVSNKSVSRQSFARQTELIPRFIFSRKFQWNFHAAFEYILFSVCWVAFFFEKKRTVKNFSLLLNFPHWSRRITWKIHSVNCSVPTNEKTKCKINVEPKLLRMPPLHPCSKKKVRTAGIAEPKTGEWKNKERNCESWESEREKQYNQISIPECNKHRHTISFFHLLWTTWFLPNLLLLYWKSCLI